jgi:hypothetical protein
MSKVASLTSGLVVKKGQAVPAVVSVALAPSAQVPTVPAQPLPATTTTAAVAQAQPSTPAAEPVVVASAGTAAKAAAESPAAYYKALTVKLDRSRYETLKRVGLQLDKKSQEIFVEALDAYLAKMG